MSSYNNDLTLITFSDLKLLFLRNRAKIQWVSLLCGLACMAFLLMREPRYVAEGTFKQMARQSEMGMSLKDTYQQLFSFPTESATAAIMQSNEVLKSAVEVLGMQAVCHPDFILVKAIKRIYDNLRLELGQSLADPDPFTFRNISYLEEYPLKLFVKLTSTFEYQLFDQNKQLLAEGKLGESLSCPLVKLTMQRVPRSAKLNRLYPLTIQPWLSIVETVRKRIKIAPWKQDKAILKLMFPSRNRFLAADFLNQVMKSYQKYLKRENDEICEQQLTYLLQRQQELTQHYDEALIDHVDYLKDNLSQNGFVGVAQEIETLSYPKNLYTSKLFDVDLELQRLSANKHTLDCSEEELEVPKLKAFDTQFYSVKQLEDQQIRDASPFLSEKKQLETRLGNCDLDQKRNSRLLTQPLKIEIEEVKEQLREAKLLLQCVEKQETIPPFPSLQKEPKNAFTQLVMQMTNSPSLTHHEKTKNYTTTLSYVRELIEHLQQKRKILEENLTLQTRESHDFCGLNLTTAQDLLVAYTRERDNLQAQLRELIFLRDQLSHPDFEVSSLGGVFNDSVTTDLIQKASAIALLLKDDNNRSDREQVRLLETLQTQKNFLSQYLFQTTELKKLRTKLLSDKITSLCGTTASLLRSEKQLLTDKLQELNHKMVGLPDRWRRESLLMLKKELGSMMLQGVSQLAETKNLGQHIFQVNSKPLDTALPPTQVNPSKIFFLSLFSSILAGVFFYTLLFCRGLLKGFSVTEENLKASGFPLIGSLTGYCNVNLSQLCPEDLETLRRVAEFLVSQPKKTEAWVASCIGGKYPNYVNSLAELLAMRGLKVLVVNCVFDQVVHEDDIPGLWQYLNNSKLDLAVKGKSTFDYLPSGGTTRHAAELVGSAKFSSFLSQMKQKYDLILLFSTASANTAESYAFFPICDAMIITTQQEKKEQLQIYVDWSEKKGESCSTFVYVKPQLRSIHQS